MPTSDHGLISRRFRATVIRKKADVVVCPHLSFTIDRCTQFSVIAKMYENVWWSGFFLLFSLYFKICEHFERYPPEIDVPTNPLPPVNPAVNFDIDGRRHPNPNGGDGYDYPPGQRHKRPEYDYDFSNSGVQPNSFSHQCFSLMSLTLHIALMKVII